MTNPIEITSEMELETSSKFDEVVSLFAAGLITRDESRALLEIDQRLADIETEKLTDSEWVMAQLICIQNEVGQRINGKKWGLEKEFAKKPKNKA